MISSRLSDDAAADDLDDRLARGHAGVGTAAAIVRGRAAAGRSARVASVMIAERPLAADDQLGQVVPGDALDRLPAGPQHLAVGEHDLQPEHVVGGHAVLHAAQAAGVRGQVAADRAELPTRRVRRVEQAVLGDRAGQDGVEHAGLRYDEPVDRLDRQDPVHLLQRYHDAAVQRVRRTGQAGPRALRDDGHAGAAAIRTAAWTCAVSRARHDRQRHPGRAEHRPVVPVALDAVRIGDQRLRREPFGESSNNGGRVRARARHPHHVSVGRRPTIQACPGQPPRRMTSSTPGTCQDYDVYAADAVLREAVARSGACTSRTSHALGRLAGGEEAIEWGGWRTSTRRSCGVRPLRPPDRRGRVPPRLPPAAGRWRSARAARRAWAPRPAPTSPARRLHACWSQVEAGHGCPVSMTYAAVPALRADPELAAEWVPLLTSSGLRPAALRPRQGRRARRHGDDREAGRLRRAREHDPRGRPRRRRPARYRLTGHKWFCSAPMCDAFLMLAQAPGGLSCFLVPRVLPDGTRNAIRIQRLKDKLGNRSNASRRGRARRRRRARWSAKRAAASRPSSRWSTAPGSTACSARRRGCARRVAQAIHHARTARVRPRCSSTSR